MKYRLVIAMCLCSVLTVGSVQAQTWVSLNGPRLMSNTKEITLNNSGTPTLYIAEADYILKSSDGGVSWRGTGADFSGPLATVCKYTDASILVGTRNGFFRRSVDGGGVWNSVSSSPNIETDLVPLRLATSTVNTENMFLGREYVSGNHSVWRSVNSGATWAPCTEFRFPTNVYDLSTYPVNETDRKDFVFACGVNPTGSQEQSGPNTESNVNGVYFSPNNGANWHSRKLGSYNVYSIAILDLAGDAFNVYAAVKGGTSPGVYLSTDGGNSFEEDPIFNEAAVNIIRINNASSPKAIFLGTDDNVWRSTNDGSSWSKVSSFGSDNNVTSLAVSGTGTVFAGTTGSLYKSTNNGSTWTEVGKMNVSAVDGDGGVVKE